MAWNASTDTFKFNAPIDVVSSTLTKRQVLSQIAKLFDLAGWLAPVTIKAKILMQKIWKHKLSWDENLPPDLQSKWAKFVKSVQM